VAPTTPSEAPTSPTSALSHSPSSNLSSTTKRDGNTVAFATPLATTLVHPAPTSTHSHTRAGILRLSRSSSSRPWSRHTHSDSDGAQQSCRPSSEEQPYSFVFTLADTLAMGAASSGPLHRTSSEVSFSDWLQGSDQEGRLAADSWSYTAPAASGTFTFSPQPWSQAPPTKPFLPRRSPAAALLLGTTTAADDQASTEDGEHGGFAVLAEVVLLGSACAAAGKASNAGSLRAKVAQVAGPVRRLGSGAGAEIPHRSYLHSM
jgi:hypothetical protein